MDFYTIDSGKDGAIVLFEDSAPVMAYEIPYLDDGDFIDLESLLTLHSMPIYIEKITAYTPNTKTVAIQFQSYGALVSGAHYLSGDDVHLIPVPTWQSYARKQKGYPPRSKWVKNDSRQLAVENWPDFCADVTKKPKRVLHDGIADALILGLYVLSLGPKGEKDG